MFFNEKQLADLRTDYALVRERHKRLRGKYIAFPFATPLGREYADHGFCRRLGTLMRCIDRVFEILPPDLEAIPTMEQTQDASIYIQSFVVNAFGCGENLAWIWVAERDVCQSSGAPLEPKMVGLGERYRRVRASFSDDFNAYLDTRRAWFEHLAGFRDSLAHRIPLYVPPFSLAPEVAEQYRTLNEQASDALRDGQIEEYERLCHGRDALRHFTPVMRHSWVEQGGTGVFHPQLLVDFLTIEELAERLLVELK